MSETILYLAPDGNNANDGVAAPMATIDGAVARLREMRNRGTLRLPARILLRGGVYHVAKTIELDTDFPLTIAAADGETAVIDGGCELNGWHEVTVNGRKAWQATAAFPVQELYYKGKMLKRAAFPKEGMYRVRNTTSPWGGGLFSGGDHFTTQEGSFNPKWHNLTGIDVFMTHKWIEEHLPVKSYDAATGELYSTHRSTFLMTSGDTEYRFENVREALLEPGEFYYDNSDNTVTVILDEPLKADGEHPVATCIGNLLRLNNVRYLNIRNLSFRHGGGYRPTCTRRYDIPGKDFPNFAMQETWLDEHSEHPFAAAPQAAVQVPGTIFFANSSDCEITGCTISETSWYGIEASAGCSNILIDHNDLHELGAGGVRIGGAAASDPVELRTSRVTVTNNHIHDGGLVFASGVGVLITHAYGNLVEHNHIHDLFYSGVSAGWNWGFGETVARENRIGWNLIHDLGKGILSDMGGVYLLGIQPGTRVYSNYIANVKRRYYGGWGIYTDEGSSHVVVENNICTDCSSEAYHQHFGRENTLRYNIFAFGNDAVLAIARGQEFAGVFPGLNFSNALSSYNNVFVTNGKPFIRSGNEKHLQRPTFLAENSIFFNAEGKFPPIAVSGEWKCDLDEWQKRGFDRGAIIADPGFNDLSKRDFSFGKDSLLGRLGFPMLDMKEVGIQ